jgi:hypothetical protein
MLGEKEKEELATALYQHRTRRLPHRTLGHVASQYLAAEPVQSDLEQTAAKAPAPI